MSLVIRPFFLVVVLILASGTARAGQREIPAAANAIAEDLAATTKRSVAVVDFTDLQGNVTELGRFVAEEMALGLVMSRKGLSVVDRAHLKALMQEHKLGASGIIDPATARRLGQIAGVEALLTGSITPFADSVRVVVKVLDTETARVLAAASMDITKSKTIEELMARDIRGADSGSPRVGMTTVPDVSAGSRALPTFQNDRLRVTIGQLAVTSDNKAATLNLTIENTSRERVLLGIEGGYSDVRAALSDDLATSWDCGQGNVRGIFVINQMNDLSQVKDDVLTPLGPSERINIIMRFRNIGQGEKPGSSFSLAIDGLYSVGAGAKRVSIGLAGIKPTISAR